MRFSLKQLRKLKVVTVSGIMLGHICDAVFETDGQTILQYEVCKCCWFGQKLLINRSQVVRFEDKKMVVEDAVRLIEVKSEKMKNEKISVEPVMMREEN